MMFAALCLAWSANPALGSTDEVDRCLEVLLARLQERSRAPGVSACVRRDGREIASAARGWADEAGGLELASDTALPIGSLARVFWVAATLREVEGQSLKLEDDLAQALGFETRWSEKVLLRHVLEGTSGLAPWARVFSASGREPDSVQDRAGFLSLLASAPFDQAPGAAYAPNSAAWSLLPLLLERSWGKPFEDAFVAQVCKPAGLLDTQVCRSVRIQLRRAEDCSQVAEGHDLEVELARSPGWPAPALCSSARDLARFTEAIGSGALLDEALAERMTRSARTSAGQATDHGWAVDVESRPRARWWHSGGIGGHRALISWVPEAQLAIALQATCPAADLDALEAELVRFVLGLELTTTLALPLTREEQTRFSGGYQLGTTRVRLVAEEHGLSWQDPERERRLSYQGHERFVDEAEASFRVEFVLEEGRAVALEVRQGERTQRAIRAD